MVGGRLATVGELLRELLRQEAPPRIAALTEELFQVAGALCEADGSAAEESRAGLLLNNGWDEGRQRYGLMQIDRRYYQPFGMWDSEEHINQCSSMLVAGINEVRARHPAWSWDQQLRGGICTYHARAGNLQVYDEDPCSTDNSYVNSVIRRAQYFKSNGF